MKIGLVSPSFSYPGGVQEQVKILHRYLISKGHEVKIIIPGTGLKNCNDTNIVSLGKALPITINGSTTDLSICLRMQVIKSFLQREQFDLLHFHNANFFMGFQILANSNCINVASSHSILEGDSLWAIFYKLLDQVLTRASKKVDGMIAPSEVAAKSIPRGYQGPIAIIPYGIDTERFHPQTPPIAKYRDGRINILFVGRLDKRKGLGYLIDSFAYLRKKYTNIRLIIVGGGPALKRYQRMVKWKRIPDIIFEGSIPNEAIHRYYTSADIFCSPAFYGESFGVVLLEAMASGLPIVAFANKGYRQILQGKAQHFLVPSGDTEGLIEALLTLILKRDLREEMALWNVKEAQKYSWKLAGQGTLDFYGKLVAKKNLGYRSGI